MKWIFHEIEETKFRMQGQKRPEGGDGNVRISKLDARVSEIEKRVERMESPLHSSTNQSLNIIKSLNDYIIQLHTMMEESKKGKEEKDKEETRAVDEDVSLQGESPNKRRAEKRKREEEVSPDDSQSKTDEVEAMEELELKKTELAKELVP